jgi:hypothetical protein
MRTRAVAGVVLASVIHFACGKGANKRTDAVAEPGCDRHACKDFDIENSYEQILGAWITATKFGSPCLMATSWPFWQPRAHYFRATFLAREKEVFPLRDGLVQLDWCHAIVPMRLSGGGHVHPPGAIVLENPFEVAPGLALAPGDVFVPLRGDARLDSTFVATARLGEPGSAGTPEATITVVHAPDPPIVHGGLRLGDSFAWSDRVAMLVRIVEPQPPHAIGWIEVSLAPSAGDSGESPTAGGE